MTVLPGWPSGGFDFSFDEAGPIFGGMLACEVNGVPRSGVLPSSDVLVSAGTGWNLTVKPFVAVRASGLAALIGGQDVASTVAVSPAPASGSRIDVLYARPADVAAGDSISSAAFLVAGSASASPVKPSIPADAVELATFRASAGQASAAAGTIAQTFQYTSMRGGVVTVRSSAELTAWNGADGSFACRSDTNQMFVRSGGAWVKAGGDTGWVPLILKAGFTGTASARIVNGQVEFRGSVTKTAGTFPQSGTGDLVASYPSTLYTPPSYTRLLQAGYASATPNAVQLIFSDAHSDIYAASVGAAVGTVYLAGVGWGVA